MFWDSWLYNQWSSFLLSPFILSVQEKNLYIYIIYIYNIYIYILVLYTRSCKFTFPSWCLHALRRTLLEAKCAVLTTIKVSNTGHVEWTLPSVCPRTSRKIWHATSIAIKSEGGTSTIPLSSCFNQRLSPSWRRQKHWGLPLHSVQFILLGSDSQAKRAISDHVNPNRKQILFGLVTKDGTDRNKISKDQWEDLSVD